ncbi:transcription factor TFIIIB subunit [Starmerella bacillaris]|uniref:B-related factor 1 n=1 Tax=Starmerella bacillaris TaxID=1247836 RepID=A0AAV5RFK4_STABA|nr:transcription factor TFIIIB subunit [Starmerella bacillaris]
MAPASCKQCGSSRLMTDHGTNELICANCGAVAEESRIVSEVSFSETSGGKAVVTGQYINHDQTGVLGNSLYGMQSAESRHQTIEKARRRLEQIGHALQIPEHVVESALRHFRSALTNNFVKGRKSQHVLCACLYLACRQSRTDHMLMDFAEAINVNVFYIGATYLQLIRNQKIRELPIVDPTVYIQRFASKLRFGNDMGRRVVNDARLLVQRMSKDWLQQGRRPAGVAAACILLAARMNNFRRSKAEIVQVAKIAEETLQRRLDEFKKTSAGSLSIKDFRNTNIESSADPPSFTRHREQERLEAERIRTRQEQMHEIQEKQRELAAKMASQQVIDEQAYNDESGNLPFPEDPYLSSEMLELAKHLDMEDGSEIVFTNDVNDILNDEELADAAQQLAEETPEQRQEAAQKKLKIKSTFKTQERDRLDDLEQSELDQIDSEPEDTLVASDAEAEAEVVALQGAVASVCSDTLTPTPSKPTSLQPSSSQPRVSQTAQTFLEQFRRRREEKLSAQRERAERERQRIDEEARQEPDTLSDVDDDEIDSVLLNEEEIEIKSKVWMSINREYLLEQERKRLRREADAANGITKPQRKRRKPRTKQEHGEATSASASAANMLKEKVPSKKINYAAVKELFSK